jgi:phosphoglycerate dehydrogenase-like enzyme
MPTLVIHPPIDAARLATLVAVDPRLRVIHPDNVEAALAAMPAADAFFGKLTPPLLAAAPRLRWVQAPTASLEHYLFPELVAHPCVLTNMRGLFSDVIADHVLGYVLCFARNLHIYLRQQREARWAPVGDAAMTADFVSAPGRVSAVDRTHQHLADLTLGIVGVGAIGAEVARRAAAFGMRIMGVDPVRRSLPGLIDTIGTLEQLPDLLAAAHYVVIAAPHTPRTVKLFDAAMLERMRPDAVLINIGRGAIVDLTALVTALERGVLRGAALDVCEVEPLPADHPLWRMEQVLITPHVAAASPRIAERHLATLLENVRRFVNDEPLLTVVDKREWY